MRRDIAAIVELDDSQVCDDGDLISLGLDSLGVMRLVSAWRKRGATVRFADLIRRHTLAEWWSLVSTQLDVPTPANRHSAAAEDNAPFALATMQLAYWIGRSPTLALGVSCHFYFEFDGWDIDPIRLRNAAQSVTNRHQMLRAQYLDNGLQQILAQCSLPELIVHDLRRLVSAEAERTLAEIRDRESHRRLDVQRGKGFDVQLSLLANNRTRVHLNIDMLVCDAQSFRLLIDELAQLYANPATQLPELRYTYARYLAEKQGAQQEERVCAKAYWQDKLAQLKGAPQLPLAVPPDRVDCPRVKKYETTLSPAESEQLVQLSQEHGLTLSMVFMTVFVEILAKWSSESRFTLNVPLFDRQELHEDVPRMVGDFSSSILFSVDVSERLTFLERAKGIQQQFRTDAANLAYPGVDVLRDLARFNSEAASTAPGVVFTSTLGMGSLFSRRVSRTFGKLAWMSSQTSQVWLDHQVTELDGGILLNWDCVEPLFVEGVLDGMFEAYLTLLRWLTRPDTVWCTPIPELLPECQRLVRAKVNSDVRPPARGLLHEGFFDNAARHPEKMALAWGESSTMTYGELAQRASRVAGLLVQRGMQPGDRVALVLPKGEGQLEAVLGVLYGGGTYVPLGVDQPARRRARIVSAAGIRFMVTSTEVDELPPSSEDLDVILLEDCRSARMLQSAPVISSESIAYIIFTSGSTGDPKGVMVSHRSAMNTIEDVLRRFAIDANDRVLAVSSLDFDWSVADIFELLSAGGVVVVIDEQDRRDATRWVHLIARWKITLWQSVPALLDMLLLAAEDNPLGTSLRLVMLGGDWVGIDQFERLRRRVPGCRLVALGGITETSIHCTVHEITEVLPQWRSIPYGVPLSNVKCRVVDGRGGDCPDWVAGELWVGGAGVSSGYCNDPGRTARQFVEYEGERWYRSGDLARYWPTGTLEFLGRADSQVKIRGHRIELGEIQAAIDEHPDVLQSYVLGVGDRSSSLVAAVVPAVPHLDVGKLVAFLQQRLPEYMIPSRIGIFNSLPLTKNGKLDRAQILCVLASESNAQVLEPPTGPVEEAVAAIWEKLLQVPSVGRTQSFFALGGDSLLATRLGAQLQRAGLEGFKLLRLFEKPQLKDFASTLSFGHGTAHALPAPIRAYREHRHKPFPLTEIQSAYRLGREADFVMGGVGSYWYWEFDGVGVDLDKLEEALNRLIQRHEMLRAVVNRDGNQSILPDVPRFRIPCASVLPGHEDLELARFRDTISHQVMDPATWPLFIVRALRYGDNRVRIGFGFDYIVLDALSITIAFRELALLYTDLDAALPVIDLSFRDYLLASCTQPEEVAAAREFWVEHMEQLPPAPRLPLKTNPELILRPRFNRRHSTLDASTWRAIKERARKHNLTPSAVLATAFAEVLSAWSGEPALTLNLTLFERPEVHEDIRKVVGDFTSLLLVPYHSVPKQSFVAMVSTFQEQNWLSLEHKAFSALAVMRELALRTGSPANMPIVFTSTLGVADSLAPLSTPFGEYVGGLSQTPQVWLDNQVIESQEELLFNWDAVEELFPDGLLDAMFLAYKNLLNWSGAPASDWHVAIPDLLPQAQRDTRNAATTSFVQAPDRLLHQGFFEHALRRPQHPALRLGTGSTVSYAELAEHALCVAASLQQRGVQPGDRIAVTLPRGLSQIAAVLGVLAAGAAYVPVGIEHPAARRQAMYDNAAVALVLDDLSHVLHVRPSSAPVSVAADTLAYVIYTSGSTGDPKGVRISHRAAMNTIAEINSRFGVTESDTVLAVSSLDFDLSVYDIFGVLSAGGSIVLIDEDFRREPHQWLQAIRRWDVTLWNSVPALLEMLLVAASSDNAELNFRLALVSGDWVALDLPRRLASVAPACRFVALGGATEASIWSNAIEVTSVPKDWPSIPYGRPLANQKYRAVDSLGRDCPDWVPGELWIGGAGVAMGYQADSALTALKFVEFAGERWYRTGDRGRYWPDGTLEFLGRIDDQIKLRGHRIELGEIEAALNQLPSILRSCALVVGDTTKTLAACVVPRKAPATGTPDVRHALAERLPAYMIPELIAEVDSFPINGNGKIDRRKLAALFWDPAEQSQEQKLNGPIETVVAKIWSDLLSAPYLDLNRNFFAMGGDSLLATRMIAKLKLSFGIEFSLRQLFSAPTVRGLSELIAARRPDLIKGMEEGTI